MRGILKWPWCFTGSIQQILFQLILLTTCLCSGSNSDIFRDDQTIISKESIETSLKIIHDIATENIGTLCITKVFSPLKIPLNTEQYDGARQKSDLASVVLQDVGFNRHGGLLDALTRGLLSDTHVINARVLATNLSSGVLSTSIWWTKLGTLGEPVRVEDIAVGTKPSTEYPWFEDPISSPGLRSPKFAASPPNLSYRGWWTFPYYSCNQQKWILSYSIAIAPIKHPELRGFLSIDIDISELYINQCDINNEFYSDIHYSNFRNNKFTFDYSHDDQQENIQQQYYSHHLIPLKQQSSQFQLDNEIDAFHGSHKCHRVEMDCQFRPQHLSNSNKPSTINGWTRGSYQCLCKMGYYSTRHPDGFNGSIMEVAYEEFKDNSSSYYADSFVCLQCMPGCTNCTGPTPCLATYNWPFRIAILTISIICVFCTVGLAAYMFHNRKVKVFKVSSPIFLTICLLGCGIMYLEMAAIFPILDTYSCIATKWTRHMGFCVTYTALLMKTWRVSLTYRVKSAHKVKLTDKQLLQWMVPILLVMIIYLATWTVSSPPTAEKIVLQISDIEGLSFKQCSYNWWDHSLAIGEVLFLLWGIRVCYNVRNAESLYNEAKLISYAIYNIALVNILLVSIHLFIFPQAGPDIKYLLGFVRTQLSTTVTVLLVFGPKVLRILRGQGDQWDQRARARGITASFCFNGGGLMPEEAVDLYQENEELKEEISKLAGQIEFMKIVHMGVNNRHLKPKPGGYFTLQSPIGKSFAASRKNHTTTSNPSESSRHENSGITEDHPSNHSGTNSLSGGIVGPQLNGNGIEKV